MSDERWPSDDIWFDYDEVPPGAREEMDRLQAELIDVPDVVTRILPPGLIETTYDEDD